MTFRIDQFVSKIKVPIICKIDGEELSFANGEGLATHVFDKYYLIDSVGDEIVPTEGWIKEQKEGFGIEPNLLMASKKSFMVE